MREIRRANRKKRHGEVTLDVSTFPRRHTFERAWRLFDGEAVVPPVALRAGRWKVTRVVSLVMLAVFVGLDWHRHDDFSCRRWCFLTNWRTYIFLKLAAVLTSPTPRAALGHVAGEGVVPASHLPFITRAIVPALGSSTLDAVKHDAAIIAHKGTTSFYLAVEYAVDDGLVEPRKQLFDRVLHAVRPPLCALPKGSAERSPPRGRQQNVCRCSACAQLFVLDSRGRGVEDPGDLLVSRSGGHDAEHGFRDVCCGRRNEPAVHLFRGLLPAAIGNERREYVDKFAQRIFNNCTHTCEFEIVRHVVGFRLVRRCSRGKRVCLIVYREAQIPETACLDVNEAGGRGRGVHVLIMNGIAIHGCMFSCALPDPMFPIVSVCV